MRSTISVSIFEENVVHTSLAGRITCYTRLSLVVG